VLKRSADLQVGIMVLTLTGCPKALFVCHSEPFAIILSEAKDLALGAQGKLREESRPEDKSSAGFLVAYGSSE